jgi:hypothetical protein
MSESSYELEKTRKAVAAKDLELASFKVPRNKFFLATTAFSCLFFFLVFCSLATCLGPRACCPSDAKTFKNVSICSRRHAVISRPALRP